MHLTGTRQTLDLVQENAFLPAAARALNLWSLEEFVYGVMSVTHTIKVPFLLFFFFFFPVKSGCHQSAVLLALAGARTTYCDPIVQVVVHVS